MTLIPLPETPMPPPEPEPLTRLTCADAEELGDRIQQQAAMIAQATCELLLMVGEFDARDGFSWFVGLKSTAHWLSWTCSMAPGTAREHVRVARALPAMPLTVAEFRAGRLSYSKVREMSRVAGQVDEALLVDLARAMTASQLSLVVSSFRAVDGSRLGQDAVRQARWKVRDDGMVEIHAVLPAEAGAEMITALDLALSRDGTAPPQADPAVEGPAIHDSASTDPVSTDPASTDSPNTNSVTSGSPRPIPHVDQLSEEEAIERAAEITTAPTLEQRRADALLDIARTFLDAEPDDRSGEDRHLVIVQVSAEALTQGIPAGTQPEEAPSIAPSVDVPAGTGPADAAPVAPPVDVPAGTLPEDASALGSPEDVPAGALPEDAPAVAPPQDVPAGAPPENAAPIAPPQDVPAGAPEVCGVLGMGPLEARTAERLACTGKVAISITDSGGEILHLGRSRRLASRAQRRALRLRDSTCSFPGCHQSRHLDAHHVVPWSEGGPTDIDGLALLCRRHHVMVHEGGLQLVPDRSAGLFAPGRRFEVVDADGRPVQARWPAMLEHLSFRSIPVPTPDADADPARIAATTGGAGFRLADCVDALCHSAMELAA